MSVEASNPLHAAHYADQCVTATCEIVDRWELGEQTYRVRIEVGEIARRITPGQFIMVRIPDSHEPLLGRALAMYDVVCDEQHKNARLDVVFHVVGKLTSRLARMSSGDVVEVWGPLGNGFRPRPVHELIMVAGGIGQTPFLSVAKEWLGLQQYGIPSTGRAAHPETRVTFCFGARKSNLLAGLDDFQALPIDVRVATDDGSAGHTGLITQVLSQTLREARQRADCDPAGGSAGLNGVLVLTCGPEPMMRAVSEICLEQRCDCEVSLETPMACGLGICFSCVARVKDDSGEWDYKRTCVEGPIFRADSIDW